MKRGAFATILILLFGFSLVYAPFPVRAETSNVSVTVLVTECSDSVDNDSDGEIDYPNDPGCSSYADDDETDPPPPTPPPGGGGGGGGEEGGEEDILLRRRA